MRLWSGCWGLDKADERPQSLFALSFGIFQQSFREITCAMHDAFDTQGIAFHVNPGSCNRAGALPDAIHHRGVIGLMRSRNPLRCSLFGLQLFSMIKSFADALT